MHKYFFFLPSAPSRLSQLYAHRRKQNNIYLKILILRLCFTAQISTLDDWLVTDMNASRSIVATLDTDHGWLTVAAFEVEYESPFWLAPSVYAGNRLSSYGSNLTYRVSWVVMRGDTSGKPTNGPNVVLVVRHIYMINLLESITFNYILFYSIYNYIHTSYCNCLFCCCLMKFLREIAISLATPLVIVYVDVFYFSTHSNFLLIFALAGKQRHANCIWRGAVQWTRGGDRCATARTWMVSREERHSRHTEETKEDRAAWRSCHEVSNDTCACRSQVHHDTRTVLLGANRSWVNKL